MRKNPLGIISDEVSQDLDEAIEFATGLELDGLEIRSVEGKAFKDLTPADSKKIAEKLADAGLAIAGAATPVFKCGLEDKAEIARHLEIFRRSLEYAHTWKCRLIRVFAFLRKDANTREDDLKRSADHFRDLLEVMNGHDVIIGVENEATTLACTGEETRFLLSQLPDPRIGVVWDPCNILFLPGASRPVADDFPAVADRVRHVHVKDAQRDNNEPAPHCVELGKGEIDYSEQFRLLHDKKYRGWITLETHWRHRQLTAQQAHLPAGYAFSANANEPSRICMTRLKSLLGR